MSRTASVIPLIPHGRLRLLGIFLAMTLPASADDLSGQASIIDGDTLEIHGRAFDSGVLMRQKAISFVGTTTANTIAAGRRPRTTLMSS
jgi:hypothetical protein